MQPLLQALHCVPAQARINYKLSTVCHNFFFDSSPAYFSDLGTVYTPSWQLRSSADTRMLRICHVRTKTFGQRCFSYCATKQWNSLPSDIRHCIQPSHARLRKCVKNSPLQTVPHQMISNSVSYLQPPGPLSPYPLSFLVTFLLCARVYI